MQENEMPQPMEAPQAPMDQAEGEGSPIDGIISTVGNLMADPKNITPETLAQLKIDLEDLKTVLDGEDRPEGPAPMAPQGGIAGMMGEK